MNKTTTLSAYVLPASLPVGLIAAVLGSLVLALSAKIQVPFWPVPMTLQSLAIITIGMAFGMKLATFTVLLYLGEGLVGIPVFAGAGAGPAYLMGPTAGYLAGFVMAAAFCGWMAERGWDRHWLKALAALTIGHLLMFIPGVAWLATLMGLEKAMAVGFTPFVAATVLKTLLAAALLQAAWKLVKKVRHSS
ncbi:MAG: biotin transporter BioY [Magnetovibrionaceae bacterium]